MEKLINDYEFQLAEAPCAPGTGFYSVQVILPDDISAVFPYLNAAFEDTWYDHENQILIGSENSRRFAFRAKEIKVAGVANYEEAQELADEVVNRINSVWQERDDITPCYSERKLPTVIDIFRVLPKTNCKECGYMTCLAYAADLRDGTAVLEQCPALSQPEYAENRDSLLALFSKD